MYAIFRHFEPAVRTRAHDRFLALCDEQAVQHFPVIRTLTAEDDADLLDQLGYGYGGEGLPESVRCAVCPVGLCLIEAGELCDWEKHKISPTPARAADEIVTSFGHDGNPLHYTAVCNEAREFMDTLDRGDIPLANLREAMGA